LQTNQGGPIDWTCGLCCNFNFESKAVCNRPGCKQTQEDNKATYPNFERSDWKCHSCGNANFKSRAVCYSYGCEVTQGEAWLEVRMDKNEDSFASRTLAEDVNALRAGHQRTVQPSTRISRRTILTHQLNSLRDSLHSSQYQKSQAPGFKVQKVLNNKADWTCKKCGHLNWKR
jgi:hypothetical protein